MRTEIPHHHHGAWVRLVAVAWCATPEIARFEAFADGHPFLLDQGTLKKYYSAEALKSPDARTAWIEPDLCALP